MSGYSRAGQPNEERLKVIAGLIERSRQVTQHPRITDEELIDRARAFDDLLRRIPTHRLGDCYREAFDGRESKSPLLAQELVAAWRRLAGEERATGPARSDEGSFPSASKCYYCDDHGWQAVDQPERGIYRYSVRACVCDRAPAAERKKEPLAEPYWEKLPSGRWRRL
jgi:hypothetical protein